MLFEKIPINSLHSFCASSTLGCLIMGFSLMIRKEIRVSRSSLRSTFILCIKSALDSAACTSPYIKAGAVPLFDNWYSRLFEAFVLATAHKLQVLELQILPVYL